MAERRTWTKGETANARVLIVEDDALSLKLMRDVLEAQGYTVDLAVNGPDGLALARQQLPDLIVMDIGLPAMDGVEVTRSLKADPALAGVPVVAVTAYAMPSDEDRMRRAGCDAFLTKPLRFSEFVSVIGRLLSGLRSD